MLKSLLARNIALMAVIVIVSQLITIAMFAAFILRPQADRFASILAHNISVVSTVVTSLPPPKRTELIERINAGGTLSIHPGNTPPVGTGGRASLIERAVLSRLARDLNNHGEIYWRGGGAMPLWVRLRLGGDYYWVSVDAPNGWAPNGALFFSFLLALLVALAAGVVLQRRINRPLRSLTAAVDAIPSSDGLVGLAGEGPSEVAMLAGAFDRMTQRLAAQDADRALMLAGISHDLKTPLAKIRLALALTPLGNDDDQAMIERQLNRLDRMLGQFLDFARGIDGEGIAIVNVTRVIGQIVGELDFAVEIVKPPAVAPTISVRPLAFERVLINLLRNARLHGDPPIELSVRVTNATVFISVGDRGPGVSPSLLAGLDRPFVRADSARASDGGVGLGLAIAARFAADCDGALTVSNRVGGGFMATLAIPLAARPATAIERDQPFLDGSSTATINPSAIQRPR